MQGYDAESLSDDDLEYEGGSIRCKGICASGLRCRVADTSPYPTARTIAATGYCTHHVCQRTAPEPKQAAGRPSQGETGDTPLTAAVREAQVGCVLELLSSGLNPRERNARWKTPMELADAALKSLDVHQPSYQEPEKAREMLERKAQLRCVKAMLTVAMEFVALPAKPAIPPEPVEDDPAGMTVDELKKLLRKHKGKVSGKKADLVERVRQGGFLAIALGEKMQEHRQALEKVAQEWMEVQFKAKERAAQLRAAADPEPVTEEQVQEVVALAKAAAEAAAIRAAQAEAAAEAKAKAAEEARAKAARARAKEERAAAAERTRKHVDSEIARAVKRRRLHAEAALPALPSPKGSSGWASKRDDEWESWRSLGKACRCGRPFRWFESMQEHLRHSRKCEWSAKYAGRKRGLGASAAPQ